eukprot:5247388-Prorocentrum_lima.AAC.1
MEQHQQRQPDSGQELHPNKDSYIDKYNPIQQHGHQHPQGQVYQQGQYQGHQYGQRFGQQQAQQYGEYDQTRQTNGGHQGQAHNEQWRN